MVTNTFLDMVAIITNGGVSDIWCAVLFISDVPEAMKELHLRASEGRFQTFKKLIIWGHYFSLHVDFAAEKEPTE